MILFGDIKVANISTNLVEFKKVWSARIPQQIFLGLRKYGYAYNFIHCFLNKHVYSLNASYYLVATHNENDARVYKKKETHL